MNENQLLERITVNPKIFGGKPIIRGRRLAVEHVLGMLAAGDTPESVLLNYSWLELADIQAWCDRMGHDLAKVYREDGVTARSERIEKRPAFQTAITMQ